MWNDMSLWVSTRFFIAERVFPSRHQGWKINHCSWVNGYHVQGMRFMV